MNRRSLLAAFGALPLAQKLPAVAPFIPKPPVDAAISLTIPVQRGLRLGDRCSFDGMAGTYIVASVSPRTMNLRQSL